MKICYWTAYETVNNHQQVNNHHYIIDIGGEPKQTKLHINKHIEYPKWFSQSIVESM